MQLSQMLPGNGETRGHLTTKLLKNQSQDAVLLLVLTLLSSVCAVTTAAGTPLSPLHTGLKETLLCPAGGLTEPLFDLSDRQTYTLRVKTRVHLITSQKIVSL